MLRSALAIWSCGGVWRSFNMIRKTRFWRYDRSRACFVSSNEMPSAGGRSWARSDGRDDVTDVSDDVTDVSDSVRVDSNAGTEMSAAAMIFGGFVWLSKETVGRPLILFHILSYLISTHCVELQRKFSNG